MSYLDPVTVKDPTVILTLKCPSGSHKKASKRSKGELSVKRVKYDMQKGNDNA